MPDTEPYKRLALAQLADLGYTLKRGVFYKNGSFAFHPVTTEKSFPHIDWYATTRRGMALSGKGESNDEN